MKEKRFAFQKGDWLAAAVVVVLAVAVAVFYIPREMGADAFVAVYHQGELVEKVPLGENKQVTVDGTYTNVVTIRDGKAAITESDCPGEDCVRSGTVSASGRSIVCLPNGVEVRVISGRTDVDFVVG